MAMSTTWSSADLLLRGCVGCADSCAGCIVCAGSCARCSGNDRASRRGTLGGAPPAAAPFMPARAAASAATPPPADSIAGPPHPASAVGRCGSVRTEV
eukprot:363747-Chlamydomonas_euryale.AAC.16